VRLGSIVWVLGLVGLSLVSHGAQTGSDTRPVNLTIKGMITNIPEASERIKDDTYLQLVLMPPDGKLPIRVSGGRITYVSALPKTAIPAKGSFSIECKALEPGKYVLAAQMFRWSNEFWHPFLSKGKTALEITIPKDATGPILDVGRVTLPVPPR